MDPKDSIYLGLDEAGRRVCIPLSQCNRHGLISGASGTGKTVTMKVLAEAFSRAGVPVFLCDVKGDVSGIAEPGTDSENMRARIERFGLKDTFSFRSYPTVFYDLYARGGHPVRVAVSDMGPTLLSAVLGLTEVQEGVLNIVFRIADEKGLELIDLKDLRAMLNYVGEHRREYTVRYGQMAAQSLGAVTRALIPLEDQGGIAFFGEPSLDIRDWLRTAEDGRGCISLLDCVQTVRSPRLYSVFLLWMMGELFDRLPEVGDPEKPRLVFFFDEAHLLFDNAPKALVEKIGQTVKLIRSKGVGIFFVTQSPADIPDSVLAQLSNKVQHALRAYTPAEQKAVRAAAASYRPNPAFRTEEAITSLGTGVALTSFLDENGVPQIVRRTSVVCPESRMGPADEETRAACLRNSPVAGKYDVAVDRDSAYEKLAALLAAEDKLREMEQQKKELEAQMERLRREQEKALAKQRAQQEREAARRRAKIESQLISAGGSLLRRSLLNILKK